MIATFMIYWQTCLLIKQWLLHIIGVLIQFFLLSIISFFKMHNFHSFYLQNLKTLLVSPGRKVRSHRWYKAPRWYKRLFYESHEASITRRTNPLLVSVPRSSSHDWLLVWPLCRECGARWHLESLSSLARAHLPKFFFFFPIFAF